MKTKQVLIKKGPDSLWHTGDYSVEITFLVRQSDFSEVRKPSDLMLFQSVEIPETIKECKNTYGLSKAQIVGIVNDELGFKDES